MPRIRTLTAAGVLAGATVLGGAGLAGATSDGADVENQDQELVEISDRQETPELSTFESDEAPTAPGLPDAAAERAATALAEAPAFATDEAASDGTAEEETTEEETTEDGSLESDDGTTDDGTVEPSKPDNHGQRVSEIARSDDPGPGPDHGPAVAAVANENGRAG